MAQKDAPRKQKAALERRAFIYEQAKLHGSVSFVDIEQDGNKRGYGTGWQSLRDDEDFFKAMRLGVRLDKGKFVFSTYDFESTYKEREGEYGESKQVIGKWAGALIWGPKSGSGQDVGYPEPCRDMILNQLREPYRSNKMPGYAQDAVNKLCNRLTWYWEKKHRYCALDAGTTTAAVANYLMEKKAPDSDAGIASLAIVTNAPRIEKILESVSTSTDVIVVGGQLRKDTLAHTGPLCEQCLNAWQVGFDIAVVGTTSLNRRRDSRDLCFACDSPDEARTKGLLLEKADIRCVVMSSEKYGRYRFSDFMFASLSNEFVDLLITDEGIHGKIITDGEIHDRAVIGSENSKGEELLDRLHKAGIGVLVAK